MRRRPGTSLQSDNLISIMIKIVPHVCYYCDSPQGHGDIGFGDRDAISATHAKYCIAGLGITYSHVVVHNLGCDVRMGRSSS
jgi:hypothetical protein